jgi:DNA-binding MarR family transcriptional regulator
MITTPKKESLSELLLALRRRINENVKEGRLKQELTITQLETLWFIQSAGKSTMERVATHLGIKAPSVTALVDKLQKAGFVSRIRDKTDRRVTYVALTGKTKRQLVALNAEKEAFFTKLFAKIPTKDRKEFERILSLLVTKPL